MYNPGNQSTKISYLDKLSKITSSWQANSKKLLPSSNMSSTHKQQISSKDILKIYLIKNRKRSMDLAKMNFLWVITNGFSTGTTGKALKMNSILEHPMMPYLYAIWVWKCRAMMNKLKKESSGIATWLTSIHKTMLSSWDMLTSSTTKVSLNRPWITTKE